MRITNQHTRHYCDGHEYRYKEDGTSGIVRDNYGDAVAGLYYDSTFETVTIEACSEIIFETHANSDEVATFAKRAELAIGQYAASEY